MRAQAESTDSGRGVELHLEPAAGVSARGERRAARRYAMLLPIAVRRVPLVQEADLFYGKTVDISSRGAHFIADQPVARGTTIELSMAFPREISQDAAVFLRARAHVVRVMRGRANIGGPVRIAARFESCEIVRAEPAAS